MARVFGEFPITQPGAVLPRSSLSEWAFTARLRPVSPVANARELTPTVVSGGYEDDEDYGDYLVYTGHGGNDPSTRKQVADQELAAGNLALATSSLHGEPVRVVRGTGGDPSYSPTSGFRYDGLFFVERYWSEVGKSGFLIFRYELVKTPEESAITSVPEGPTTGAPAPRIETSVQRLVRNTNVASRVKRMYDYRCQVCGLRLDTPGRPYAEGAHIRPLGRPHDGPDLESNVLCLCPTDHVRFDYGAFWILDDLSIVDAMSGEQTGALTVLPSHAIDLAHLKHHRDRTRALEAAS